MNLLKWFGTKQKTVKEDGLMNIVYQAEVKIETEIATIAAKIKTTGNMWCEMLVKLRLGVMMKDTFGFRPADMHMSCQTRSKCASYRYLKELKVGATSVSLY